MDQTVFSRAGHGLSRTPDVLNGIAKRPGDPKGTFWITGKQWPWLFHVKLHEADDDSFASMTDPSDSIQGISASTLTNDNRQPATSRSPPWARMELAPLRKKMDIQRMIDFRFGLG